MALNLKNGPAPSMISWSNRGILGQEDGHRHSEFSLETMVIFHSYVKLPEGMFEFLESGIDFPDLELIYGFHYFDIS